MRYLRLGTIFTVTYLLTLLTPAFALKVGVIAPFNGPAADYGTAIQRGIDLALSHDHTAPKIEFVYEDASYDPKTAVVAFNKLRLVDRVDVIYVWGVSFCRAIAPIAESVKFPTIGQCIDPKSSSGRKFFIRFQNSSNDYMELQASNLQRRGATRIAVVLAEHPYLQELHEKLGTTLRDGQQFVSTEVVSTHDFDFRAVITRLKSRSVDAVGVFLFPGQIAAFLKQARELKLVAHQFGTNFLESESEIRAAGDAARGVTLIGHTIAPWFTSEVQRRWSHPTQMSFCALAHDFAATLVSLNHKEPLSQTNILDRIKGARALTNSAAGPFRIEDGPDEGTRAVFQLKEHTL